MAQDAPEVEGADVPAVWVAALPFEEELEAVEVVALLADALDPEELVDELAEDVDPAARSPPGMVSRSPGWIRVEVNPFLFINAETDVSCCAAMRPRVSPDTTVCVLLEAVDVVDVAAAEVELPENDRFWPG